MPGESPWTEEPGGLQSPGLKESDMAEVTHTHTKKVTFECELERDGIHKDRSWVPARRQEAGWEKGRSVRRQDVEKGEWP